MATPSRAGAVEMGSHENDIEVEIGSADGSAHRVRVTTGASARTGQRVVVGVDFGTLSGRAVVVRVDDGAELGSAVHEYPHGVMDRVLAASGRGLPADWALQVPADYLAVLRQAVPKALAASGAQPKDVIGIGTDFTASTPLPVRADGTPLCELPQYRHEAHAYVKLWKHHAAQPYADRINAVARRRGEPWLARYGGQISAEWQYAKALQLLEEAPATYAAMDRWIEAADWIVWQLCGTETRNESAAGYKSIYQEGRYPSREYLGALNPDFADFAATKLDHPLSPLGSRAGALTAQAAAWTGLPEGIAVCVGNVDAHVTVPAANAVEPGQMMVILGTSTCHLMTSDQLREVPGMCGVVDGGILAGAWGYEAGQSGVGDIFGWFVANLVPGHYQQEAAKLGQSPHAYLADLGAQQPVGAHGLIALDWHNGNRSVLEDHELSGVIIGLTTTTRPEEVYRALLEATAFGTRMIIEAFERSGIPVAELVVAGGLLKNPLLMQIYADVTRRPLSVIGSQQGSALGSAIHAAVAAGAYPDIRAAASVMGRVERAAYRPDLARAEAYDALYAEYAALHDYFGRGDNDVMHRLRRIKRDAATP